MKLFEPNYLNLEYWFNLFYRFFVEWLPEFIENLPSLFFLRGILLVLSIILVIPVVILMRRISDLRREETRNFLNLLRTDTSAKVERNENWDQVMNTLSSDNPADWKQAIIKADIMLDEMVKAMNYPGDNLGERLRAIEPSDFLTLQDAWEAHKLRNRIAHEGDFVLTRREAQAAIERFERVFREFNFI